ncbi:hypothetical protein SAMN04487950_4225 [Halogranum rubrum]|uniref:Uncharacterized protein n=1 Tax=Halogranum rubrum TaxID=553466 RepID=A0A1I4IPD3_9EURY|nr:hypothetical protein [Halogranum rubrum]SFL56212.1 hypothetical protein SAMN04487950_4225 [Halogranum rubrum]
MPSRRELIGSVAGLLSATAGCLGNEDIVARCGSRGVGSDSRHLRRVAPIEGEEEVALGILVSEQAVTDEAHHRVSVRDTDDNLLASIPLLSNRGMSSLDPDDYSVFSSDSGELYAVQLGPPPVHGEYTVSLVDPDDEPTATVTLRFNCYTNSEELP